jgi:hypothetical protein
MLFEAFLGLKSVVVIHHTGELGIFSDPRQILTLCSFQTVVPVISKMPTFVNSTKTDSLTHSEIDHMVFGAFDK